MLHLLLDSAIRLCRAGQIDIAIEKIPHVLLQ